MTGVGGSHQRPLGGENIGGGDDLRGQSCMWGQEPQKPWDGISKVRGMWEEAGRSVQVEGGHGLGPMESGGHRGGYGILMCLGAIYRYVLPTPLNSQNDKAEAQAV